MVTASASGPIRVVLEFDHFTPGIRGERLKNVQSPLGVGGASEPLQCLRLPVYRAAQLRGEPFRALEAGQGAGEIALLEAAAGHEVLSERIGRRVFGHERELGEGVSGVPLVEQEQAEAVPGPEITGIRGQDPLEELPRLRRVAILLTIQRGERKVDLQVASIGMGGGQAREDLAGGVVVELSHQANGAIVRADHAIGLLAASGNPNRRRR